MDNISVWIAIVMGVVVPVGGFVLNALIKKNNDETKELLFKKFDEEKINVSTNYVRKDMYEQAMKFHAEHSDEKFKSMMQLMMNQYENVEEKIEELKKLINEKLNGHSK